MVEAATLTIIAHHLHQRALTKHENCRPRDRAKSARGRVLPRPTRLLLPGGKRATRGIFPYYAPHGQCAGRGRSFGVAA
jgi:hypothetical protein